MEGQVQEAKKSVGELRVRADFNVSGSDVVAEIKRKSAALTKGATGSEDVRG